jgi:hypothetical protein
MCVNFDPGAHVFNAFEFALEFGCDSGFGHRGTRCVAKDSRHRWFDEDRHGRHALPPPEHTHIARRRRCPAASPHPEQTQIARRTR